MEPFDLLSQQIAQTNVAGTVHRFSRLLSYFSEHRWATDGYPDVRSSHVQLLRHIDPDGTRHTTLAQRAQITKQTMGQLVKDLTGSGYVSVVPDPADNRAQRVQLTPRGHAFRTYLASTLLDLERTFTSVVGPDRYTDFSATLAELLVFVEQRQRHLSP